MLGHEGGSLRRALGGMGRRGKSALGFEVREGFLSRRLHDFIPFMNDFWGLGCWTCFCS